MSKEKIFIISGEDSGDLHGAKLVASIKQINPNCRIFWNWWQQNAKSWFGAYRTY